MVIMEMLEQSGILTLLGMAVVFSFLCIMVFCVSLTGKAIHRSRSDKDQTAPLPSVSVPGSSQGGVTAAIAAAVNEYQKTGNR